MRKGCSRLAAAAIGLVALAGGSVWPLRAGFLDRASGLSAELEALASGPLGHCRDVTVEVVGAAPSDALAEQLKATLRKALAAEPSPTRTERWFGFSVSPEKISAAAFLEGDE